MDARMTLSSTDESSASRFSPWRLKGIGVLRIIFGVVWGVDAWFKWQPSFINNFSDYLNNAQAQDGQPAIIKGWIGFWINTVNLDPHVFAHIVAISETLVAVALVLGVLSNLTYIGGALLTFVIWSTAESFGGPYVAGSADVGAGIIYVLVFAGLFLSYAGLHYGLDGKLTSRLGRFGFLASGPLHRPNGTPSVTTPVALPQRAVPATATATIPGRAVPATATSAVPEPVGSANGRLST